MATVPQMSQRRKYRPDAEKIKALRRIIDFWECASSLFAAGLTQCGFDAFERQLLSSDMGDAEVLEVLASNPKVFCLSMLPSQRREASRMLELRHKEQLEMSAQAREDMWIKKMDWFEASLQADHHRLESITLALPQIQDRIRAAGDKSQRTLLTKGEVAVQQYLKDNLVMVGVRNEDDWKPYFVSYVAGLARPSAW